MFVLVYDCIHAACHTDHIQFMIAYMLLVTLITYSLWLHTCCLSPWSHTVYDCIHAACHTDHIQSMIAYMLLVTLITYSLWLHTCCLSHWSHTVYDCIHAACHTDHIQWNQFSKIDGFVHNCSISSTLAIMEILQFCTKPLISSLTNIRIPIMKMQQSWDRLKKLYNIPVSVRHLYTEPVPRKQIRLKKNNRTPCLHRWARRSIRGLTFQLAQKQLSHYYQLIFIHSIYSS